MFTKKITVLFTVALMSLGLLFALGLQTAEAKRIGSGGNMGQQKQSFSREATPPSAATPSRTATAPAAAAGGASKWLGPLAGLAAGGLLAALFFGGAFDGLKPMDFLLIIAFAIGAFLIFRALRKPATPASSPYATAGAPNTNPIGANSGRMNTQTTNTGYSPEAFMRSSPAVLTDAPHWFDEHSFIQGAKNHFTNLQKHWDSNELSAMQEYFTPELFTELAAERARIGNENNVTDVQSLDAQLLDLSREQNFVVASVLFQGQVRENYGQPEAIAEIWHVRHAADTAQGDWLISGIQQYNQVIH